MATNPSTIIQLPVTLTGLTPTSTATPGNVVYQVATGTVVISGPVGAAGPAGPQGAVGQGIPTNGKAGQILYSNGAGNAGYWGDFPTISSGVLTSPDGTQWKPGITNLGQPTWNPVTGTVVTNTLGTAFGVLTLG